MLYGFTVTKHGTDEIPIHKIIESDYRPIWRKFQQEKITIVYKFVHHGDNHIHYHGLVMADGINYKRMMTEGYSIKFEKNVDYERWHNYCKHEEREEYKELQKHQEEQEGQRLLIRAISTGHKLRHEKPNILFKLKITGGI